MTSKCNIIKIGGAVSDNPDQLSVFLKAFSQLSGLKILIHGGGKKATSISKRLGLNPHFIEGRRVTDANTLEVATMVYGGLVNKNIVALLQQLGTNAIGLSGADANIMTTVQRPATPINYGYVGEFHDKSVNIDNLEKLINCQFTPIICSLTHDGKGQILNTNADTIAQELSFHLNKHYHVSLHYCFEFPGVLKDINDHTSTMPTIHWNEYQKLKSDNIIHSGLIPKLDNAFKCAKNNIDVRICHFSKLAHLSEGTKILA